MVDIARHVPSVPSTLEELSRYTEQELGKLRNDLYDIINYNAQFNGMISVGSPTAVTVSGGIIAVTKSYHTVDTEGGAAADDLDTINGGEDGDLLVLRIVAAARKVTVKDGTGNLEITGDCVLGGLPNIIVLLNIDGTSWIEVTRRKNT